MVAVFTIIFNRQDIGIYSNGSNGIGVLSIFLNKALQSIFINTNYIILIIQIATAYAVIYSNDSMTGFCGSDSISIIFLNGFDEFIFIEAYSIIIVTVIILTAVNSYIILTIILCSSNGVCVILLNKIAQLVAVDINLISMITFYAFICNFQDIGCRLYGSNSISPGNAFQLISYPAAGCYIFYNRLNVIACRIINPYRQLAIFIQVSFHAGVSCVGILRCRCILNKSPQSILVDADPVMFVIGCWIISISIVNGNDRMNGFCCGNRISIANAIQLIGYPLLGSDAVYRACKGSAGIISNLGSQRAVCKGQFIINNFGISINNTNCNLCTIFAYQCIGINCCALPCSCLYLFNNLIL